MYDANDHPVRGDTHTKILCSFSRLKSTDNHCGMSNWLRKIGR
jgi:hypothetical protein